jgi:hypothetical protein
MCILGVLFREGEVSANRILLLLPRTQAPERLKMFLTQLEKKGKIKILARDNMRKGLKTYMITQSGKETVQNYLYALSRVVIIFDIHLTCRSALPA